MSVRVVVLYESMFGNTRAVADAIGDGFAHVTQVTQVQVVRAGAVPPAELDELIAGVDLLVVGAPTHAWGMSRPTTRKAAADTAGKPHSGLTVEPGVDGPGIREWLGTTQCAPVPVATFDTRMRAPLGLSGSAARKIARRLRHHGCPVVSRPRAFLVDKQHRLLRGQIAQARTWAEQLATTLHSEKGSGAGARGRMGTAPS